MESISIRQPQSPACWGNWISPMSDVMRIWSVSDAWNSSFFVGGRISKSSIASGEIGGESDELDVIDELDDNMEVLRLSGGG